MSSLSHKKCGQGFKNNLYEVTPVRAVSAGFKNDSLGVSNDSIFIIVCSISMKYMHHGEAMNPDKGVRSTRRAHWSTDIAAGSRFAPYMRTGMPHSQPSYSLTCPAFSLTHTCKNGRACVFVSLSHVVEHCYSTCVYFCSDSATLLQFSHAQPPELHTDPHRLPAGSLRHGGNNGESRKRATVEIQREARHEVKSGCAESRGRKKTVKKVWWRTERLSHGVKKRSLRWSSVEEEAT